MGRGDTHDLCALQHVGGLRDLLAQLGRGQHPGQQLGRLDGGQDAGAGGLDGELLGALRFPGEGYDYREQSIAKGVYTLRYGLLPINGDHLGVSPNRDYALLLPAAKDTATAALPRKKLEAGSAESAGTSHPAILMLTAAPGAPPAKGEPALVHDEEKNTWGVVVPLSLAVEGESSAVTLNIQLVVVGVAPV